MRLWAISDLHVAEYANRQAIVELDSFDDDWLLLAGDIAENRASLRWVLEELSARFGRLFWTPGNHELWSRPNDPDGRGVDRYHRLVDTCRAYGCSTPEDPYVVLESADRRVLIAPVFTLYDYSFRPASVPLERAVEWASEADVVCVDEYLLHSDPFPDRIAWCHQRVADTEAKLQAAVDHYDCETVLVSHFPLRSRDVRTPRIPCFSIWCGTQLTQEWHSKFRAQTCVFGHLHARSSTMEHGCRFEEVSLGYQGEWDQRLGLRAYLREIAVAPKTEQRERTCLNPALPEAPR